MHLFDLTRPRAARALVAGVAVGMFAVAATAGVPATDPKPVLPHAPTPHSTVHPRVAPDALRAALRDAWQQHPDFRVAQAQVDAAGARLEAAGMPLYNPELAFAFDDEGADRSTTAGVNLTLDINDKRGARRSAASARFDQASAQAQLQRREFARQWLAAWAELQTAGQRVLAGERRLALLTRFADLAARQFAADDISGLERDLALLARDEARAGQAALIAEHAQAQARFLALGGSTLPDGGVALPSDTLPPPRPEPDGTERMPEWRIAQAASVAAEREVGVAQRDAVADPTVGVHGGRIDEDGRGDNVFGVSVSIPLFVRNDHRNEVAAARADAQAAVAQAERVRIELAATRRGATDSYAAAQSAWTLWRASRGTDIERRTGLLERLWREGELSTSDYLLQLNQTLDTALAGAELEARLWRSYADYLAATGQLERWAGLETTP
ncbi:TolC family protein [Montanilutibacter psychrotolerans]|uniref:TolC family protein n=1 Tax=Montanilutibacter psychrotolerans TaxID=1327343 RepID=A0A3M8SMU7_9GAMM|nr:TolC family protein [Lysobacter psychrotolerans]RNF82549.1 TolC family protein [Lysobacter psychrotolerans]